MNPWWESAVGYEVYLRSFADGDGDGLGDLHGLRERLGYLADLGVDAIWITPCFPSPGFDHGYDVADYLDVAPEFGGLPALDRVLDRAHEVGIKVVLDLVPNHTSSEHPWFHSARSGRDSPHHDWYVWRDGSPDTPPTNYRSHFGGPAWTWDETCQQWYLHRFLPEQPDLNWRNEEVRAAFDHILTTWLERGVDGFRIDVAQGLLVDEQFRDNPEPAGALDQTDPVLTFAAIDHVHDLDQPGVIDIHQRFAAVASRYDGFLLGEVYLQDPERVARYVTDGALHRAFWFPGLHTGWDADAIRSAITGGLTASEGRLAWVMSSHDDPRAATRFGDGAQGAERQLAYLAFLLALPGMPVLYQGDELGLDNGVIPSGSAADPISVRNSGAPGRDGSRTPMPWRPGPHLGFSTTDPWLPLGTNRRPEQTAEAQSSEEGSFLSRTREFLHTRRAVLPRLAGHSAEWLETDPHILAIRRGSLVVLLNVGGPTTRLGLTGTPELIARTSAGARVVDGSVEVATDTCAWVRVEP